MDKNVLIVDDDKEIVELIRIALENEGFATFQAYNGEEAYDMIQSHSIHLVVLDVMMPKMDGLTFCALVRKKQSVPILMVSAKSGDMDKIQGLMTGADDYMTKPFNVLELVMRVKALVRRTYYLNAQRGESKGIIRLDPLVIDRNKYTVTIEDKRLNLTSREFEILYLLASHRGKVYSAEDIFQHVWKERYFDSNNTVMVHISNLRDKIDKVLGYKVIHTVWGVGYKIEE